MRERKNLADILRKNGEVGVVIGGGGGGGAVIKGGITGFPGREEDICHQINYADDMDIR